ncbi:MAG: hypothetical protein R3F59_05220 [Myxococcota bacterium]
MSEGRIVGQGRFRVDRRRALEKMERFQLEDPHRYVLEWIAAANAARAPAVDVVNDADDLRMRWACAPAPDGEDLDRLFDHVWGTPDGPHEAMLQHLGLGVLGALGLGPRWIHLDSGAPGGDLRLDVTDPAEALHRALGTDEVDGLRCHVREGLTATTVREALAWLFQEPAEARLVRGAARWSPATVTVNGRPIARPEPPAATVFDTGDRGGGWLWFALGEAQEIDVVRHGVTVARYPVDLGAFTVGGWWRADALRLNASRSAVVDDAEWQALLAGLDAAIDDALQRVVTRDGSGRSVTWRDPGDRSGVSHRQSLDEALKHLARAAIRRLAGRGRALGELEAVDAFPSVDGRWWSLAALRKHRRQLGTSAATLHDPGLDRIVFAGEPAAVVRELIDGVPDLTDLLQARAEGRRRRAMAAQTRYQTRFPEWPPSRTVQFGDLTVSVRSRAASKDRTAWVQVGVGRVPLGNVEVEVPAGRLEAIVDSPRIVADAAFREVVRDEVWEEACARLREVARDFVVERLIQGSPPVTPARCSPSCWRRKAIRPAWPASARSCPRRCGTALVFAGGGSWLAPRCVSLNDLAQGDRGWVAAVVPAGTPPREVRRMLLVPGLVERWKRLLGPDGRDVQRDLRPHLERERRLAAPPEEAVVRRTGGVCRAAVALDWLQGEVMLPSIVTRGELRVLRGGAYVCTLGLASGALAVVDGPDLAVSPAHDALDAADELRVRQAVEDTLQAAVRSVWPAAGPDTAHPSLLHWLRANRDRADCAQLPIAWRLDGTGVTAAELRRIEGTKGAVRVKVVDASLVPHLEELPSYGSAVAVTEAVRQTFDAIASGAWRDATKQAVQAAVLRDRFLERPRWVEPPSLARCEVSGLGWTGVALLPLGQQCGRAALTVLWRDRVLTHVQTTAAGASLVVWGKALQPTRNFDKAARQPGGLNEHARSVLSALVGQAVEAWSPADSTREAWLALAAVPEVPHWDRLSRLPLLRRVAGPALSLQDAKKLRQVCIVAPDTAEGEADGGHGLDAPGVRAAIERVGQVKPSDERLRLWRQGRARHARHAPRPAVVPESLPVHARAPLEGGGEVALLIGTGGLGGLRVEPLVEGRPLASVDVPLAVPAVAVVTGDGVRADLAFERVVEDEAWLCRLEAVREAAVRLCEEARPNARWLRVWALGPDASAAVRAEPLFPLVDGTRVSADALAERSERDRCITICTVEGAFPATGLQPVLGADAAVSDALQRRFTLRWLAPSPLRHGAERVVALRPGTGDVEVRISGRAVRRIRCPGPYALQGAVDDPALTPVATWDDLVHDAAWDALQAALEAASREALVAAIAANPDDPQLLDALMAEVPDRLRPTNDPVLRALRRAPLLRDVRGGRLSLDQLAATQQPVRCVREGARGDWLPDAAPFVAVSPAVKAWLKRLLGVVDADEALARETAGAQRRLARPWPRPVPPPEARAAVVDDAEIRLWLGRRGSTARILHGGRDVCGWGEEIPGLTGWIDGTFETDAAFLRAELPHAVEQAARREVVALLQREADQGALGRTAAANRLREALGGRQLRQLPADPRGTRWRCSSTRRARR